MTDTAEWQAGNERYLSAALAWLRARLVRQTTHHSPRVLVPETAAPALEATIATPAPPVRRRWFWQSAPTAPRPAPVAPLVTTPQHPVSAPIAPLQDHDELAAAVQAAEQMDPPPALLVLAQRLGLSRFEWEVLLLCAAVELDTRIAELCARAQDNPAMTYPTFALALALFDDPAWDVLSPERGLRHWRLVEIAQSAGQPLTTSPLHADERIVNYLKGLNYLDDRLSPFVTPVELREGETGLAPSQERVSELILHRWSRTAPAASLPMVQLLGPDMQSKQLVAWHTAQGLGCGLYRLPAELLPAPTADLETLARLWQRESLLLPVALLVDAQEVDPSTEGKALQINRLVERCGGVLFLASREVWTGLTRNFLVEDISRPRMAEQRDAWQGAVGEHAPDAPTLLSGQFNLNFPAIREVVQIAEPDAGQEPAALTRNLWDLCLDNTRPRLDALAQRVVPVATWDDLVLPVPETAQLQELAGQVEQRTRVYDEWGFGEKMSKGWGISALFAGESGTGKSMAAEVLANELRLNLYRIDLSAVVSKYIGETEKNLRRLFDAAEDGGALLFFDEADALFSKRSEVKDSHDRYANIETNYLLQRMEAYRGLAVLATNMRSALDHAFLRRLRFIITFPFPDLAQRRTIWDKVFPVRVPRGDLELDRLARFPLTGGMIHNIALNAAFVAARQGSMVTMPIVLDAVRAEFRKMERPVPERDFLWTEPVAALP